MYCIECGTQNLDSTRYCNKCGSNLETLRRAATGQLSMPPSSALTSTHVGWILGLSTVLGMGALLVVFACIIAVASANAEERNQLAPVIVTLGFLALLGVSFLVTMMLRMISRASPVPPKEDLKSRRYQLPEPTPMEVLPPRPDRVPSVVEHTTHNLPQYVAPERDSSRE